MASVQEILANIRGFLNFASVYWLTKCLKAMLCGTAIMPMIFLFRRILRDKSAAACCYAMLLLIPMPFMGMSRLFYQRYFALVTVILSRYIKAEYGYVYFGIMSGLAAVFVIKILRMKKALRECRQITDSDMITEIINSITDKDRNVFQRSYLRRIKVYVAHTDQSPFSGGILYPYIVMPEAVWENWDKKSREAVLCHEMIHIKSGHILWLTLFKILTFLWWANPLIYLCEAALKEDIEHACDEGCIVYAGISKHAYGCLLLTMIGQINNSRNAAAASFLNRNDYGVLKKRIGYIAVRNGNKSYCTRQRISFLFFSVCMTAIMALIFMTSYPRYTLMREVAVFDEELNLIAYGQPVVQETFTVKDGKLLVDKEKFEQFIASEGITDEYVYVSFNTIMKLPGMGGLGNVGMVNIADTDDIFYLSADTLGNKIMEFCLKYLI